MPDQQKKALGVVYDHTIGRVINRILKGKFEVEIVTSLEEAHEKINGHLAVITDWTEVDGREVVKISQERGIKKIIIMNGGLMKDDEIMTLKESGVDIIPKPFDQQDLINAIRGKIAETKTGNEKN